MAINDTAVRRAFEKRFFLWIAILFPIVALIGFGPSYYLKSLLTAPPVPSALVHIHGLMMSAWIILFATQVYLIRSTRIKVHQRLGIAGVILGLAIIVTGLLTAVAAAKYGSPVIPSGITPHEFLVIPFGDMLVFAILFAAAIYYRRNGPNHKRLMILTVLNFVPPALARFPFGLTEQFGPLWFFGVPGILAVAFVVVDTWRNRKLNMVFLAGAVFLIASQWLRLMFSSTQTWQNFATWVTGL